MTSYRESSMTNQYRPPRAMCDRRRAHLNKPSRPSVKDPRRKPAPVKEPPNPRKKKLPNASTEGISSKSGGQESDPQSGELDRSLNFWDNLFFGVGSILEAGIYAIVGEAARWSGSMLWLSLIIAALTALFTACCYGELVSLFPDSGGGYELCRSRSR